MSEENNLVNEEEEKKDEKEVKAVLPEEVTEALKGLQNIPGALEAFNAKLDQALVKDEGDKKEDKVDFQQLGDIETLDRKDFLSLILGKVQEIQETANQPIVERLEMLTGEMSDRAAATQVKEAEARFPDFWDWKAEMAEAAKYNPYLTADQAYTLARAGNPEKAKELDKKHKGEEKKEPEKKSPAFGGLLPTSGKVQTEGEVAKDATDAAEKAWQRVMGTSGEVALKSE